jgi:chromosome segregation ATPase
MLKPGKCRIIELAEECSVSRTTAEKFIDRFSLTETSVLFNGREVAGVDLTEEDIQRIGRDYPRVLKGYEDYNASEVISNLQPYHTTSDALVQELRYRIESLEAENKSLHVSLADWKVIEAKLSGELEQAKTLNEQLALRLEDKDNLITSLKSEAEAQKLRAETLNNQVATNNAMVQYNKGAAAEYEKLTNLIEGLSQTQIEIRAQNDELSKAQRDIMHENEELKASLHNSSFVQKQEKKPAFKIFGFELSRS